MMFLFEGRACIRSRVMIKGRQDRALVQKLQSVAQKWGTIGGQNEALGKKKGSTAIVKIVVNPWNSCGSREGTRTLTPSLEPDFESKKCIILHHPNLTQDIVTKGNLTTAASLYFPTFRCECGTIMGPAGVLYMSRNWETTSYPGVRFRKDKARQHNRRPDRYFTIRYYKDHKLCEEALGWASEGWTPANAGKLRAEIVHNIQSGSGPQSLAEKRYALKKSTETTDRDSAKAERDELFFRDLSQKYLCHAREVKRDWYNDTLRLKLHILPLIGAIPVKEISVQTIRNVRNALTEKRVNVGRADESTMAPATVIRCLTIIRKIFYFASVTPVREHIPDIYLFEGSNPVRNVEFPKQNNARERILWEHEEQILWPALQKYPDTYDAALLSRRTGMRRGEVLALKIEHVDIHSGALRLMDTKNGTNRTVFATDTELMGILRQRVLSAQELGTPWIFPNASGENHLPASQISKMFKIVVDKTGLNAGVTDRRLKLVFHCLRHTFGTEMIIKGMNLLTLKRIMGHKILSTTERYVHIAEELQKHQAMQIITENGWGISLSSVQGSPVHHSL